MNVSAEFEGKVAIVTGAGRGMGLAVARRLAAGGARIVVNDIDAELADGASKDITATGASSVAVCGDVASAADVDVLVAKAITEFGGLHILINNAGVLRPTRVEDIPEEEWDFVIGVNLKGTFLCSQRALPHLREAGWGRIVNFSSTAGKSVSTIGGAHYTTAKAGILGFTRHLAKEVASEGITVNAVCPGLIDTEMVRSTIDQTQTRAYAESFPVSRLGRPEEVADTVAFLASDKAAYITGAAIDVNGGGLMV